jgi:hypothetical protein
MTRAHFFSVVLMNKIEHLEVQGQVCVVCVAHISEPTESAVFIHTHANSQSTHTHNSSDGLMNKIEHLEVQSQVGVRHINEQNLYCSCMHARTDIRAYMHTCITTHACIQANKQTDRRTDRQTSIMHRNSKSSISSVRKTQANTCIHTYICTHMNMNTRHYA